MPGSSECSTAETVTSISIGAHAAQKGSGAEMAQWQLVHARLPAKSPPLGLCAAAALPPTSPGAKRMLLTSGAAVGRPSLPPLWRLPSLVVAQLAGWSPSATMTKPPGRTAWSIC